MSAKTTFTCNLCRKDIDRGKSVKDGRDCGFALRWATAYRGSSPIDHLETTSDWIHCPIHLCFSCIDAVANFRDTMKKEE